MCLLTYLLTYLLTPRCTVLLEKLTGLQLVKKFAAFHGTRRFITALTSVRHLSLSWASPIQSIYPHPTSWRSILILSTHLRLGLPSGLLPSGFLTKTLYTPSPRPYVLHGQPISFFSILPPAQYWVRSTNHLAPRYAISFIPPLPRTSKSQYIYFRKLFNETRCTGQSVTCTGNVFMKIVMPRLTTGIQTDRQKEGRKDRQIDGRKWRSQ